MADREKDRIISKVYFADGGFGSARETLKDVRETNPEITLKDVQAWREKYIPRKAPMRGFNSYVAPGPKHQFQVDLFVYKFAQPDAPVLKRQKGKKYTGLIYQYGLLAVDSFTKYTHVVPIDRKLQSSWKAALEEIFEKMGTPKQIYSDPDSSLLGNKLKGFLESKKSRVSNDVRAREHRGADDQDHQVNVRQEDRRQPEDMEDGTTRGLKEIQREDGT